MRIFQYGTAGRKVTPIRCLNDIVCYEGTNLGTENEDERSTALKSVDEEENEYFYMPMKIMNTRMKMKKVVGLITISKVNKMTILVQQVKSTKRNINLKN